jgi:hypothetical protein
MLRLAHQVHGQLINERIGKNNNTITNVKVRNDPAGLFYNIFGALFFKSIQDSCDLF